MIKTSSAHDHPRSQSLIAFKLVAGQRTSLGKMAHGSGAIFHIELGDTKCILSDLDKEFLSQITNQGIQALVVRRGFNLEGPLDGTRLDIALDENLAVHDRKVEKRGAHMQAMLLSVALIRDIVDHVLHYGKGCMALWEISLGIVGNV